MKKKINLLGIIIVLMAALSLSACTNGTTYADLNREYNRKNGTQNRSMALDTIIATTLYNNPEIGSIGLGKHHHKKHTTTHSVTDTSINTVSNTNTFADSHTSMDAFGGTTTTSHSSSFTNTNTTTQSTTNSGSKSHSTSSGINIRPTFFLLEN